MTIVRVEDIWLWVRFVGTTLKNHSQYFFRGQSNSEWPIQSTFERKYCTGKKIAYTLDMAREENRLRAQERRLLTQFVRDGWRYTSGSFGGELSKIEWYSLMRHNGIPTRMIDFTESALIALYFALSDCNEKHDFAVWCVSSRILGNVEVQREANKEKSHYYSLDAMCKLNRRGIFGANEEIRRHSTGLYYNAISAISANEKFAESILGDEINNPQLKEIGLDIVHFFPRHRNARMGAQSGLFLMSTHLNKSFMEALQGACDSSVSYDTAEKIVLTTDNVESMHIDSIVKFEFNSNLKDEGRMLLQMANITPRTVYPDMEGIAKELRGEY